MKTNALLSIILFSVIFMSCNKDETRTGISLAVDTTSDSFSTKSGRISGTNDLVFSTGAIVIREVIFDGDNSNASISRTVSQVASIDYSTGAVSPEMFVEVPAGDYTSVNLGIELQDVNSTPSIVLEGTYTNSDDEIIPIRFEFNSGEVFEANAASVTIPAGADIVGKITFDALAWFAPVTRNQLDNCSLTDGVIVISETSNQAVFDIVADRLDVSTQAVFE